MSYTKAAGVQASRNIRGFPLAMRITRFERRKLEILLKNILERLSGPFKGKYFKLAELNRRQRKLLDDRHVRFDKPAVHTALALSGCNRDWPDGRGVFINDDMNFIVLTNHSDHLLVVSCDDSVGDLKAVFQRWSVGMMILEGYLNNTPIPTKSATQSSNTKTLKNNDEDMTQRKHLKKTVTRRHIFERNEEEDSFIKDQEESIRYYEFQYSDRLGYVACSPQNLGSGLYSTITIELSELGEHEDSLKVVCEKMGLRAVYIPPTVIDKNDNQEEKSNDRQENKQNNGVQNCNDGTEERERNKDGQDEDEEEEDGKGVGEKRRGKEEGEDSQEDNVRNEGGAITKIKHIKGVEEEMKTSYEDQKIGGNDGRNKTGKEERKKNTKKDRIINNARKGYEENVITNGGNMNTFRLDQPILKTIYNISNIDCMGQSEVQLTQKVIDGVAAIIEIEKKIKDGSRIDDFLSIPATPPLPAPPLRKMSSGATLALITESIF